MILNPCCLAAVKTAASKILEFFLRQERFLLIEWLGLPHGARLNISRLFSQPTSLIIKTVQTTSALVVRLCANSMDAVRRPAKIRVSSVSRSGLLKL